MPARKLTDHPTTVRRFDVLAIAPRGDDLPVHVMLCSEKADREDVTIESELRISHMGPPLGEKRAVKSHAVGSAELNEKQQRKIETFVHERFDEWKTLQALARAAGGKWDSSNQYRIHPPATNPSRDCNFWRFSCVGFVLTAYDNAEITLLGDTRPLKNLQQIKDIYADSRLDDPAFRKNMGIGEGDQWPVALAGYVLNALSRPSNQIHGQNSSPFEPREGHEYFPSQSPPAIAQQSPEVLGNSSTQDKG